MPAGGGLITDVHAYWDAESAPGTGYVCIWNASSGALMASASVGTVGVSGNGWGAQHWHSATLGTPLWVAGGVGIAIGFWMPQTSGLTASVETGGSSFSGTQAGSPGTASGPATGVGALGAYADYLPLSAHILRGGVWTQCSGVDVLRSSAWGSLQELEIERSSAWTPTL